MDLAGKSVLIVDDDADVRAGFSAYFEDHGAHALEVSDGTEAVRLLQAKSGAIDLVLTDIVMPEMDGIGLTIYLRKHFPSIPVVAMSGGGHIDSDDYLISAKGLGARVVLNKPILSADLDKAIASLRGP